jgi:hypothetical protein
LGNFFTLFTMPGFFDWKAWSIPRSLLRKIYNP